MTPVELLREAERVMEQPDQGVDGVWARSAALLTRQALEGVVRQRLILELKLQGRPSFTSQLLALRELVDDELAAEVSWAWSALSRATHHHGYALPPTVGELARWSDTVRRLVDADPTNRS